MLRGVRKKNPSTTEKKKETVSTRNLVTSWESRGDTRGRHLPLIKRACEGKEKETRWLFARSMGNPSSINLKHSAKREAFKAGVKEEARGKQSSISLTPHERERHHKQKGEEIRSVRTKACPWFGDRSC